MRLAARESSRRRAPRSRESAPAGAALVVVAMCLGSMISMFNSTLVNVMVPAIGTEFRVSSLGLEWVSAAYTLAYGALLLLGGALGASYGRRTVFLAGIAVFTVASIGCAFAPGITVLLVGRAVQGVGVALLLPQTLAILATEFTDRAARARVVGIWAGVASLGLSAGPVLGGLIVSASSWRAGFALSAVIAVAAFVLGLRGVPAARHGRPHAARRVDWVGAVLGAVALAALVEGPLQLPDSGLFSPFVLGAFVVGVVMLPIFVAWQHGRGRRGLSALMPLPLWRSSRLVAANLAGVAYFFMFFGILYFYSIDLQEARGYTAIATGLMFLPMMLLTALFGPIAGRLAAQFGTARVLVLGLALGGVGALLLSAESSRAGLIDLEWRLAVVGAASGLMSSSMSNLAVSDVGPHQSSTAAAVHNTFRQIGSTLGVALLGVIIAAHAMSGPTTSAHATTPGLGQAMAVTAILMFVTTAAVLGLTARSGGAGR